MTRKQIIEFVEQYPEEAVENVVLLDGLDEAFVGLIAQEDAYVAVYSVGRILDILIKRDSMDYSDAMEFYDFNIGALNVGPQSPLFMDTP